MRSYFAIVLMIVFCLAGSNKTFALSKKEEVFAKILYNFNSGDYGKAILKLDKIKSKEFKPISHYWKGICYGKLQKYTLAIREYKTSLELGATPKDIYYELGQAYYSILDYKNAKTAFKQSILKRFKVNESFYYLGYMELSGENYEQAVRFTKRIIEIKKADRELMQAAYFQIGEAYLGNIEKKNKRISHSVRYRVNKYVIPMYEKALQQKSDNQFAGQIYQRQMAIRKKYGIKRKTYYNGRPYPQKYTNAYISTKLSYDSNVIQESSDADDKATNKASNVFTTNGYISSMAIHRRRLTFKPELSFNYVKYLVSESDDTYQIYQNDTFAFTPGLKTSLEHKMRGKPANFNIDLTFDHTKRKVDAPTDTAMKKYGNTFTLSLNENMTFKAGTLTKFEFVFKQFSSYDDNLSSKDNGIFISHSIFRPTGTALFFDLGINAVDARNDTISRNETIVRASIYKPKYLFSFDMMLGFGITFKDMKRMEDTRGMEVNYAPYLIFSRTFAKKWILSLSYNLTKQTSKSTELYAYTQHMMGAELKYNFF